MAQSRILDMGEHLIPPNSLAETAALVTLPSGESDVIEIFGGTGEGGFWSGWPIEATYEFRAGLHTSDATNTEPMTFDIQSMLELSDPGDDPSHPENTLLPLTEFTTRTGFDDRMNVYAINCLIGATRPAHVVEAK